MRLIGFLVGVSLLAPAAAHALCIPSPLATDIFTVNSTADDCNTTSALPACNCSGGHCTLRGAILAANAHVPSGSACGANTVIVPAGTYTLALAGFDQAAQLGDLDITRTLHLQGASAATTIIDGNGIDRVFDVIGTVATSFQGITIQGGATVDGQGGGAAISSSAPVVVVDAVLRNNVVGGTGSQQYGGAINTTGSLDVTRVSFLNNSCASLNNGGGAVAVLGTPLSIVDSLFDGNSSVGPGGALSTLSQVATLTGVTFTNNHSNGNGGGFIYQNGVPGGAFTLTRAFLGGNSGLDGAAFSKETSGSSTFTATNVTVSGNTGNSVIYFSGQNNPVTLRFLTVANNTLPVGNPALVNVNSTVNVVASIFADAVGCGGASVTDNGYNLDSGYCVFHGTGSIQASDPRLFPLADNGGNTRTHALRADSPAIDTIPNAWCTSVTGVDQRGVVRGNGNAALLAACDMGAFERTPADAASSSSSSTGSTGSSAIATSTAAPSSAGASSAPGSSAATPSSAGAPSASSAGVTSTGVTSTATSSAATSHAASVATSSAHSAAASGTSSGATVASSGASGVDTPPADNGGGSSSKHGCGSCAQADAWSTLGLLGVLWRLRRRNG